MSVSIAQLRVIAAVAQSGSIAKAARACGVSQPTVSAQLTAFEKRYRTRIFRKEGRRVELTPFGASLLPQIRKLLLLANDIDTALADGAVAQAGRLRLGYSAHQFIMPVLTQFMRDYPRIRIEARAMASRDLLELLGSGSLEAAFVTLHRPEPNLVAMEMRDEEVVVLAPRDHPFAQVGSIGWDDLATASLIVREPASGTRLAFEDAASSAGIILGSTIDLGSWEAMCAGVSTGIGLGIAMRGELVATHDLVPLRIAKGGVRVRHCLVTTTEMRQVATVDAMFRTTRGIICEA